MLERTGVVAPERLADDILGTDCVGGDAEMSIMGALSLDEAEGLEPLLGTGGASWALWNRLPWKSAFAFGAETTRRINLVAAEEWCPFSSVAPVRWCALCLPERRGDVEGEGSLLWCPPTLILGGAFLDNDLYRSVLDGSAETLELLLPAGVEKKRPLNTLCEGDRGGCCCPMAGTGGTVPVACSEVVEPVIIGGSGTGGKDEEDGAWLAKEGGILDRDEEDERSVLCVDTEYELL